jgi:hypothetical protein
MRSAKSSSKQGLLPVIPLLVKDTIGGRTWARRKPYKNDTRKPSNRATNKRICKYKAITTEEN